MKESATGSPREQERGSSRLQEISHAYKQTGTLIGAIEVDIFTAVSQGASEVAQIAPKVGLKPWATQKLVDACTALGLLERRGGRYYNASDVERYLVKGKPSYLGAWLSKGAQMCFPVEESFALWTEVAAILRGDKPPKSAGFYTEAWKDVGVARQLAQAMFNANLGAGYRLAHTFDFSPYSLLLDLGGGSGCYCIAAASQYPHLRAIVMDYPTMCTVAEEFISQAGLSERIKTYPGDLVENDLPQGADVMLMAAALTHFSNAEVKTVFAKAYKAMAWGGTIIILDGGLNNERSGPLEAALYSLEEALLGGHGEAHTRVEVCDLLMGAGFVNCEARENAIGPFTMITAQKQKHR